MEERKWTKRQAIINKTLNGNVMNEQRDSQSTHTHTHTHTHTQTGGEHRS